MAGIYFHIPFCRKKCTYCDFHFSTTFHPYRSALLELMGKEFKARKGEITESISTLYFGGGSPGLLTIEELSRLINEPLTLAGSAKKEITLEVNPEDITYDNLVGWKALGINRLSIGVQSLNNTILKWMNRNHTAEKTKEGLTLLNAFYFSLSIDLIYGVPYQEIPDILETIALLDDFRIDHLSAYALTNEPNTLLSHWINNGKIPALDDEKQVAQYAVIQQALNQRGFLQYEVSNYARNRKFAVHNSNYWTGSPYLGIGPGAHSFDGKQTRRWNLPNNQRYLSQQSWFELEHLDEKNLWNELWLTGLRTINGVPVYKLQDFNGLTHEELQNIDVLIKEGKMIFNQERYTLSPKGLLNADAISGLLFRV